MQNAETILGSINHRRAACGESLQARFGGGPTEKARATGTSPAAYPTKELYLERVRFAKEEEARRKASPVYVPAEEVASLHATEPIVFIVDPRLGFNNRTQGFFMNRLPPAGEESWLRWKRLGHRHNEEAIIYWLTGRGYSMIDGKRHEWEAGDFVSVPIFAWHMHVNLTDAPVDYLACVNGPLAEHIGQVLFEDENHPEWWIYAQQGEEAVNTLVPGAARGEVPACEDQEGSPAKLYAEQVAYAEEEEQRRRQSRVLVKSSELRFGPTAMGSMAYVVDWRLGFHNKALATVVAEVPPGKRSGAHRHLYDEIDYVLAGTGRCIISDQTYDIKPGDTLNIPVLGWHQYFCTGDEPLRILAHSTRPALENLGVVLTQQGELADY